MYIAVGGGAGFLVLVLIIALWVRSWAKKRAQQWHDIAKANGLSGSGTWPQMAMSGTIDGVGVGLRHEREVTYRHNSRADRDDRQVKAWCEAHASLPVSTGDLKVAEEGIFAKLGKLVGMQDIQTGDAKFDKRFSVKSSDPERAKQLLTQRAREALLALEDGLRGEITIEGGRVRWKKGGSVPHDRAIEVMKHLAAAANAFRG